MDSALYGSLLTGGIGVLTLVISRIRCHYKRSDEGVCQPQCGCTEKSLREDHEEVEIHEIQVGDTHGVLLLPRK